MQSASGCVYIPRSIIADVQFVVLRVLVVAKAAADEIRVAPNELQAE